MLNGSLVFPMAILDYMCDSVQTSNIASATSIWHLTMITDIRISCIFNREHPCWKNTNIPYPGTIIHVVGVCSHIKQDSLLAMDVENIVLNVLSTPVANVSGGPDDIVDHETIKKCKSSTFASVCKLTPKK